MSVRDGTQVHEYDRIHPGYDGLAGALAYLVAFGFFTEDELHDALDRLVHELPEDMPPKLAEVARVVLNLKQDADR